MKPNLGLSDANREGVLRLLSTLLADEYLLYTKARNYHWNVGGPHFHDYHKFFETLYEEIDKTVDEVAERIRTLGGRSPGTLAEFAKEARLEEEPGKQLDGGGMIGRLLADHEALVRVLREGVDACAEKFRDAGTADFLTGLMEKHEKTAWMLRAHLEER